MAAAWLRSMMKPFDTLSKLLSTLLSVPDLTRLTCWAFVETLLRPFDTASSLKMTQQMLRECWDRFGKTYIIYSIQLGQGPVLGGESPTSLQRQGRKRRESLESRLERATVPLAQEHNTTYDAAWTQTSNSEQKWLIYCFIPLGGWFRRNYS